MSSLLEKVVIVVVGLYDVLKGVLQPLSTLFLKTSYIFSKIKQLRTKYQMDLIEMFQGTQKSEFYCNIDHCFEVTLKMCENQYFPCFDP